MDYKKAGVNVELGNVASKVLYEASKETFSNRTGTIGEVIVPFDDFSGVRAIDVSKLPEGSLMCMAFDGIGTKVEIAQRMQKHDTIAYDLFAMVCDDAVVRGAEPVLLGTVLDVSSLGSDERPFSEELKALAAGYVAAAKEANVAVINGEIAELGSHIGGFGSFKYNWASGLVWFARKEKLFTGKEIQAGDSIVLFEEKGFRSNGLSLARKVFATLGDDWHEEKLGSYKLGELVLEPSTVYSKAVVALHGGFETEGSCQIHGVSHITGGGLPEKLGRVLRPSGFGAVIDSPFTPCEAMLHCQELGKITDEEAYRTWNMGQGMAIITPEPEKVIAESEKLGITGKLAGKVTEETGIRVSSQGCFSRGESLSFQE